MHLFCTRTAPTSRVGVQQICTGSVHTVQLAIQIFTTHTIVIDRVRVQVQPTNNFFIFPTIPIPTATAIVTTLLNFRFINTAATALQKPSSICSTATATTTTTTQPFKGVSRIGYSAHDSSILVLVAPAPATAYENISSFIFAATVSLATTTTTTKSRKATTLKQ